MKKNDKNCKRLGDFAVSSNLKMSPSPFDTQIESMHIRYLVAELAFNF